jgi:methylmalonyl-CoA mutase
LESKHGGILQHTIATEFQKPSYDEWLEVANKSLKGKTVSEYVRNTFENIKIKPLYTKADLPKERIHLGDYRYKWKIAQQVEGESIAKINKNILEAIEYGQPTVAFKIPKGLNKSNIEELFKGINFAEVSFFIDGKEEIIPFYQLLFHFIKNESVHIEGFIGFDPVRSIVENSYKGEEKKNLLTLWCNTIKKASDQTQNLKTLFVDGRFFEQTGGNAVQQIAFTLSTAVEQIENLKEAGVPVEFFFKNTVVGLNVQSNFFMEIAKLRAMRYLWKKLAESYEVDNQIAVLDLFAETTMVNKSKLDPYTNMLRSSGEAFAAVIGQVQTLRIQPFDAVYGETSKLGVRFARNIHHILREESSLANVKDPAAGSYFIEHLTNELIEKSWQLFLQIEELGGLLEAFNQKAVEQLMIENRQNMLSDLYKRKIKLIGTNQYADISEKLQESDFAVETLKKLKPIAIQQIENGIANGDSIEDFFVESSEEKSVINYFRLSEEYEKLRFLAKKSYKEGNPPRIGLIGLGMVKEYKKITDFVSDFCASGGILAEPIQEEIQLEEISRIVNQASEKIIGFAGTDDHFEQALPFIEKTIVENHKKLYLIAGLRKKEVIHKLKELGVTFFIDEKADHVETLKRILVEIGGDLDAAGVR